MCFQLTLLLCDSLLVLSIMRIFRARRKLMGNGSVGVKSSELNAALVILLMAALPLSIYIPNGISYIPYIFSSVIPNISVQIRLLSAQLYLLTLDLSIFVHMWNIFVYTARVSGFRSELFRLLTCGLYKQLVTSSQSFNEKSESTVR